MHAQDATRARCFQFHNPFKFDLTLYPIHYQRLSTCTNSMYWKLKMKYSKHSQPHTNVIPQMHNSAYDYTAQYAQQARRHMEIVCSYSKPTAKRLFHTHPISLHFPVPQFLGKNSVFLHFHTTYALLSFVVEYGKVWLSLLEYLYCWKLIDTPKRSHTNTYFLHTNIHTCAHTRARTHTHTHTHTLA